MHGRGVAVALPYQTFIALRYLMSKKRHRSLSLSTAISLGGVAVGVMALLVVLAVMSGFHEDLQGKILGVNTHVVVLDLTGEMMDHQGVMDKAKSDLRVVSTSPFILGQAMVSSEGNAHGVYVRGVSPDLEIKTTNIEPHMKAGSLLDLKRGEDETPGIILGKELAERLGAFSGDDIKVVSPFGGMGPMGNLPRVKKFKVVGVFEVGMFEYDSNLVLTTLESAREFFGLEEGGVSGIELRVNDVYRAREVAGDLKEKLGYPYHTRDWIEMNRNLFSALKLEKLAMFIILTLIVLVASFNIVSTQIMNVMEKEREIAILKAMGATNGSIMSIFMLQGFLIGAAGTIIGMTGGLGICYLLNTYELIKLPADVYYLSHLPAKLKLLDFLAVTVSAVLISFLATLYPAWQASRLDPVEPLRYE